VNVGRTDILLEGHKKAVIRKNDGLKIFSEILDIDCFPISGGSSFFKPFAHGWMWMNGIQNFGGGSFQFTGYYSFGYHFSNIHSNHVAA
jgi:hypothetical protein